MYCEAKSEVFAAVKNAKKTHYRGLIDENKNDPKKLFRVINSLLGKASNTTVPSGDLKRAGRLAIRHSNSHRSNRNKNMERGGVLHLSTLKIMTLTGLDLCPESSRWTYRYPQHIQPRKEKDLEEDASFHRPAPVMSEDED
ncbi:hypothetical protein CAPTEDRAFT_215321 [Capitella teleta]|uniref:Uncharacterized protein n=1 Tax=Capitella teleta TaxID=283909 RepID=R7UUD4_CAPTE|nr:hypothetical protein CAPTEDRAFT_215321 [Capitella teleta]|eukprot:ELU10223.1 hypothetical protein CAPTEDRAFT_215321 [Capitella teleta]